MLRTNEPSCLIRIVDTCFSVKHMRQILTKVNQGVLPTVSVTCESNATSASSRRRGLAVGPPDCRYARHRENCVRPGIAPVPSSMSHSCKYFVILVPTKLTYRRASADSALH